MGRSFARSNAPMMKSRFLVLTDPERWKFWKGSHVVARISRFEDAQHPYGKWTVRLSRTESSAPAGMCRLVMEFLVDEAPLRDLRPGLTLPCFYGIAHIADLTVESAEAV